MDKNGNEKTSAHLVKINMKSMENLVKIQL